MATSSTGHDSNGPGANGALGTSDSYGNGSELDTFMQFDGNLSKSIISAQMKEIETMLKLPTSDFDYTSFQELVHSLAASQGILNLYQNTYVALAANAAPPDDILKRRVNLAWAVLLHIASFASMKQLIIRGRAKERAENKPASHIHITFTAFLKRLCLLKNEDTIDPVREWDLLADRIANDRNDTAIKACILKEHYLIVDHIDRVADLSATMTPPRPYTDHEKISKYIQCIGDTLRGKLQMGNLATNGKAWDALIEEIPTLIATQRRLEKEKPQNPPAKVNQAEQQKGNQKDKGKRFPPKKHKQAFKANRGGGKFNRFKHQRGNLPQGHLHADDKGNQQKEITSLKSDLATLTGTVNTLVNKLTKHSDKRSRATVNTANANQDIVYPDNSASVFLNSGIGTIDADDIPVIIMPALVLHATVTDDFLVDSGANRHICNNKDLFTHFVPRTIAIMVANGITEYAEGEGHIGDLYGVLYCPGFTYNILSVTAISTFYELTMGPHKVVATAVSPPFTAVDLAVKRGDSNLYFASTTTIKQLEIPMTPAQRFIGQTSVSFAHYRLTDAELWHQRLNHASNKRLNFIRVNHLSIDALKDQKELTTGKRHHCDACGMCKTTHLGPTRDPGSSHQILQKQINKEADAQMYFNIDQPLRAQRSVPRLPTDQTPRQLSRQQTPKLSKFCMDLHGPMPTQSIHGTRYFLLITDYNTRYRWIYLLIEKSDTIGMLQHQFIPYIKTLRSKQGIQTPIVFRSDNGGEFKSNKMTTLLQQEQIEQSFTTPYTPHTNGIAERSNRTILEAGAAMMMHMEVPTNLWDYALQYAVFVENRLPSDALGNKSTPYFELFGVRPSLAFLRTFGCISYHVLPSTQQSQQPLGNRAERGRFLGFDCVDNGDSTRKIFYSIADKTIKVVRDLHYNEYPTPIRHDASTQFDILNDLTPLTDVPPNPVPQPVPEPEMIPTVAENPAHELAPAFSTRSTRAAQRLHEEQSIQPDQPILTVDSIDSGASSDDGDSDLESLSDVSMKSKVTINDNTDVQEFHSKDPVNTVRQQIPTLDNDAFSINSDISIDSFDLNASADNNDSTEYSMNMSSDDLDQRSIAMTDMSIDLNSLDSDTSSSIINMNVEADEQSEADSQSEQSSIASTPEPLTADQRKYTFHSTGKYLECHVASAPTESHYRHAYSQNKYYCKPQRDFANHILRDERLDRLKAGSIGTFDSMSEGMQKSHMKGITKALNRLIAETPTLPNVSFADALNVTANSGQPAQIINLDSPLMQDALNHSDDNIRQKWHAAFNEEIDHLFDLGCFESTDSLPHGKKPTGYKFVFKIKPDKFKVRLTFKGFQQVYGSEFTDTFAPTVQLSLARFLLALITHTGAYAQLVDIKAAFPNADLPEDIDLYMKIPAEVRTRRAETGNPIPQSHEYFRLRKALYGMKQASREWYRTLSGKLLSYGYTRAHCDSCLFTMFNTTDNSWLMIYVDDMLVAGSSQEAIDYLVQSLKQDFELTVSPLTRFLGMDINYDRQNRVMTIDQERYVNAVCEKHIKINSALFEKYKFDKTRIQTPMEHRKKIVPRKADEKKCNPTDYRSLLGAMQYLSLATRLDITYAVNQCCRVMSDPSVDHLKCALRILAYLQQHPHLGIKYDANALTAQQFEHGFHAYADADHGGDDLTLTSRSGVILLACGGPVMWSSKQQKEPSGNGTAASEVKALFTATQEIAFIRGVMDTLGHPFNRPTVLHTDSTSAETFTHGNTSRMKSLRIQYAEYEHHVSTGAVRMQHVSTADMLADIHTKSLDPQTFKSIVRRLMWNKLEDDSVRSPPRLAAVEAPPRLAAVEDDR
jgi:hypothetical protein